MSRGSAGTLRTADARGASAARRLDAGKDHGRGATRFAADGDRGATASPRTYPAAKRAEPLQQRGRVRNSRDVAGSDGLRAISRLRRPDVLGTPDPGRWTDSSNSPRGARLDGPSDVLYLFVEQVNPARAIPPSGTSRRASDGSALYGLRAGRLAFKEPRVTRRSCRCRHLRAWQASRATKQSRERSNWSSSGG